MAKKLSAFAMSITPFDKDFKLDEAALRLHLRRLRDGGVSVYVASSATGEGFSLDPEELDRVLAIAVEELKGRVAVRAMGCEPRRTSEMVAFLRRVESFNLDAAHISALEMGHGAKPTPKELGTYYSTAIESTSLPVVISSYQALGFVMPVDLIETLVNRHPNITGFIYGGADVSYLAQVVERLHDRIEIHCAGPSIAMTTLGLGGNGFIGHEGNLAPQLVSSIIAAFQSKDAALDGLYRKLMGIFMIHRRFGGARALKPLLNALGLPGGMLRPPRVACSADELNDVIMATMRLNLPGIPAAAMSI